MITPIHQKGMVFLIGAGPGDPGLLTLRGAEVLRQADVVLYDYLVNPAIAELAPPHAQLVCLGERGATRVWSQEQINTQLVESARAGQTVVRLKGGDPLIFGRLGEECEFLDRHGVAFEVIPGISAATAAAAYAGIFLTHRSRSSAVAFVTGQERSTGGCDKLNFAPLAQFPGTLVVYMGVSSADEWVGQLLHHGMPGETPAAMVRRCSLPDQQVIRCQLKDVPARLKPEACFPPPVIVIVGKTAHESAGVTWFEARPLFGQRVMVTRPKHQVASLRRRLETVGARVMSQPVMEMLSPASWAEVDPSMRRLSSYDWLIFSSANGVAAFFSRLRELGYDARHLGACRLAAIGPGTASEVERAGLRVDLVPDTFCSERLAETLVSRAGRARFLLVRGDRSRPVLRQRLAESAAAIDEILVYQSQEIKTADEAVVEALRAGEIDWVTVTSSAIAAAVVRLFGSLLERTKLASISPLTSQTLRELGFPPAAEAAVATMDGLVEAIIAHSRPSAELARTRLGQGHEL
jgi:uroporphyrinogen III methyltransferase/synthase